MSEEDFFVYKKTHYEDVKIILSYFKHYWENAMISDAKGHVCHIIETSPSILFDQREFVIYKDSVALKEWNQKGYSEENSKTAFLVMIEDDTLCFTFNENEAPELVDSIKKSLRFNRPIKPRQLRETQTA